jgi:hypothetical protein
VVLSPYLVAVVAVVAVLPFPAVAATLVLVAP